jgi:(p)ppGpp synthase/HD superfamily hydrolase
VVIAALLHDAVEDQEVPVEMIAREFGKQVADIVMEVTDDKTLPKDERKRKQIETAPKKSREAKLIKLADKTSNLRAVASSPAADWSVKRIVRDPGDASCALEPGAHHCAGALGTVV